MKLLTKQEIIERLQSVSGWVLNDSQKEISRTFIFKDFSEAMSFVSGVAKIAEAANHHPDIDIRWNKVTLVLSTHDADGLTELDFEVAQKIMHVN